MQVEDLHYIENKQQILDNVTEISITYIPYEQLSNIWIMGDFTEWEPILMNKNKDIFTYTIVLIRGFKYYYLFNSMDTTVIDFNHEYELNPGTNQANNFINLPKENSPETIQFEYKLHSSLLKEAKKNFTKARMGNDEEVLYLENVVEFSTKVKTKINELATRKEEKKQKIKRYFDGKIIEIKNANLNNYNGLCDLFKKRIVVKDKILYYIDNIDLNEQCIKCMKLYDRSGMKIQMDYYIKKGFFLKFYFKDLEKEENSINGLNSNIKILSKEESENIMTEWENNTSVLKIYYKLEEAHNVNRDGIVFFKARGKVLRPMKSNGDLDLYDIETSAGMITEVKTKEDNLRVQYLGEEIKEEPDNRPISLQIFYNLNERRIPNVLHIHSLNDEIQFDKGFEVFHLERTQDETEYKNCENSSLVILFKNYKIYKIYHKNSQNQINELKGEELNYKQERIVKIKSETHLNNYYAKIKKLPIYHLAHIKNKEDVQMINEKEYTSDYDRVDICNFQSNRTIDFLSGFVDVSIIFDCDDKFLEVPLNVSLPVCMLTNIPINKEMELEKIYLNESKKRKSNDIAQFENLHNDVIQNIVKLNDDDNLFSNLNQQDIKSLITKVESYRNFLPVIGKYVETNELWTYLEVNILIII